MAIAQQKTQKSIPQKKISKGVLNPASTTLLQLLKKKNRNEEPTFLLPTKYISQESAKVGYLFNNLLNRRRKSPTIYRTFFAGSYLDACSGVVKIIRHNHWNRTKGEGKVLFYDKSEVVDSIFHPLNREEERQLVRGVQFESSFDRVKALLQEQEWIGFIWCYEPSDDLKEMKSLFKECKEKNIITVLDESHLEDWYKQQIQSVFDVPPDIYLFGENVTNREVPFGSFSMSAEVYKPWNSIVNCLTHSSSYTGNTICLSMILELFKIHQMPGVTELPAQFSKKEKYSTYAKYINPAISWIFYVSGLSPEIRKASGSQLLIEMNGKEERILDGAAGSGCCLRGHNPEDLVEDVFETHDNSHNYWNDLCQKLTQLSGMPHVFPAASGSSATDISIIISLLANSKRSRIITFKHNYSGKTLISLNFSRFESFRRPFHPFYFDVLELDPFEAGAADRLHSELTSGKVALIWFELLQGQNLDIIPQNILDLINRHQDAGGYLVGIDEILTGFFRTGNFLCSEGKIFKPDVIALAKGISDMTFPMGAVLVSERAYQMAKTTNPSLVNRLETYFITQIGSHIALNGLEKSLRARTPDHVKEMQSLFFNKMREAVASSPLHKEARGQGLLLYMKLNKNVFPINILGEEFIEFLMSSLYLNKGKVLFLNSRLTPSLGITKSEMEELCERLQLVLKNTNRFALFFFCLKQIMRVYLLCGWQKVKERFL